MSNRDFALAVQGYSMTTAEILYRMPDHPDLLQTFLWQCYDIAPKFPRLVNFLDYWVANLDGPLHTVRVAHKRLISPAEFCYIDGSLRLN